MGTVQSTESHQIIHDGQGDQGHQAVPRVRSPQGCKVRADQGLQGDPQEPLDRPDPRSTRQSSSSAARNTSTPSSWTTPQRQKSSGSPSHRHSRSRTSARTRRARITKRSPYLGSSTFSLLFFWGRLQSLSQDHMSPTTDGVYADLSYRYPATRPLSFASRPAS